MFLWQQTRYSEKYIIETVDYPFTCMSVCLYVLLLELMSEKALSVESLKVVKPLSKP